MKNKIMKNIIHFLTLAAFIVLTGCGGNGKHGAQSEYALLSESSPTIPISIESIQVTPADIKVPKGTTGEYTALAYYSDGTSKDVSDTAAWTSTNPGIVSFSSSIHNYAEALAAGTSTVFATADGIQSNIAKVEVTNATLDSIQLTPVFKSVPKGIFVQYQVTGHYNDSSFYDLTPYAALFSSNTAVATIQSGGSIPALAQTLSVGTTQITATFDTQTSNTAELNVTAALLSLIHITPDNVSVPNGTTGSFSAEAYYDDGTHHDVTKQATWDSSDTSIVNGISQGDEAGYAEAVGVGHADVSASFDGKTSNIANVEVRDAVGKHRPYSSY